MNSCSNLTDLSNVFLACSSVILRLISLRKNDKVSVVIISAVDDPIETYIIDSTDLGFMNIAMG